MMKFLTKTKFYSMDTFCLSLIFGEKGQEFISLKLVVSRIFHATKTQIYNFFWLRTKQYIIPNYGILKLNSSVLPSSKGYISQYTHQGVYGLVVNQINEEIIYVMTVKMICYPYQDSTWDIRSNISLCLREYPRASPSGTRYI